MKRRPIPWIAILTLLIVSLVACEFMEDDPDDDPDEDDYEGCCYYECLSGEKSRADVKGWYDVCTNYAETACDGLNNHRRSKLITCDCSDNDCAPDWWFE